MKTGFRLGIVTPLLVLCVLAHEGARGENWTWYISGTNVVEGSPGYVDVTISVRANTAGDAAKLGNHTLRGTMSADLYDFGAGNNPVLQANYLVGNYTTTLTNPSGTNNWQRNCFLNAVGGGDQVTVAGIAVTTIRFYILNTSGTANVTLGTLQQTFLDDNTTAATVTYDNTGGNPPLPITIGTFTAQLGPGGARLKWTTVSEKNNFGFYVQRRKEGEQAYIDLTNGFIPGHGTTNVPQVYSFVDQNAVGASWSYRLRQVDLDGTVTYYYPTGSNGKSEVTEIEKPAEFNLAQNYPNPFNPTTRIQYALPKETQVRLEVFNLVGQKVATLVDALQSAGYYEMTLDATRLPSGLYFFRLATPEVSFLKKMMVVK